MIPGLVRFLERSRRIQRGSLIAHEVSWRGRRVDLATLTASGSLSAYELKMGNVGRVLEQAIYNASSFDRSWVVVDRVPTDRQVETARSFGIGVLVVGERSAKLVLAPAAARAHPIVRRRLAQAIRSGQVA